MISYNINHTTLEVLLDNYMYRLLVIHGRKVSLYDVNRILLTDNVVVPSGMALNAYELACDLYDSNEESGWNDDHYPGRE